jgi:1,2-diacylglycerol 3-alpha-glucosyltransferase
MRIGICAFWFNRGQGVIARQLRSAVDQLGHQTFVLGRPTRDSFAMPQRARGDDVWAQQGVTPASSFFIGADELLGWAREHQLEGCFFDQNYEFEAIEALRRAGTRTIGRFVWEQFSNEHVADARRAYDLIYSMTHAERERYATMGIETPFLQWGIHPDYLVYTPHRPADGTTVFHYHAGLLGKRKPFKEVIEAFNAARGEGLRLIVKAQIERWMDYLKKAAKRDPRIKLVIEDLPTARHLQMCADAHVCMAPARWEGLGLHLYEAIAFGQPIVCNDDPPMNELIEDEVSGLLIGSHEDGKANSGIPAKTVDVPALTRAIERLADPALRTKLEAGTLRKREQLSWERTVVSVGELLSR